LEHRRQRSGKRVLQLEHVNLVDRLAPGWSSWLMSWRTSSMSRGAGPNDQAFGSPFSNDERLRPERRQRCRLLASFAVKSCSTVGRWPSVGVPQTEDSNCVAASPGLSSDRGFLAPWR
jgi:hypothetical protein